VATFAIGDIHGNVLALDDLLAKIIPEISPGDTVVFLGDYIDRGADSKACIERILDLRRTAKAQIVALMGITNSGCSRLIATTPSIPGS
jgi:serine/threonine protein phosphatase 1